MHKAANPLWNKFRRIFLVLFFQLLSIESFCANNSKPENNTITAIPGIRVGHYTDAANLKGTTVIRFEQEGGDRSG